MSTAAWPVVVGWDSRVPLAMNEANVGPNNLFRRLRPRSSSREFSCQGLTVAGVGGHQDCGCGDHDRWEPWFGVSSIAPESRSADPSISSMPVRHTT